MRSDNSLLSFAGGAIAGAALMYALDPVRGRRRRARARDKLVHAGRETLHGLDAAGRDLLHRGRGFVAELNGRLREGRVDDDVLVERVRSRLGRFASHPRAVEVTARAGHVRLGGPVLADEAAGLLRNVRLVRGVHAVEDALERHEKPDLPQLEGRRAVGHTFELAKRNWSPGWKLIVGAGLCAAMLPTARRRFMGR